MFKNYKNCFLNGAAILRSQQISKKGLSWIVHRRSQYDCIKQDDNKRFQTFDRITTFPYGTSAYKVCESEMLSKVTFKMWNVFNVCKSKILRKI